MPLGACSEKTTWALSRVTKPASYLKVALALELLQEDQRDSLLASPSQTNCPEPVSWYDTLKDRPATPHAVNDSVSPGPPPPGTSSVGRAIPSLADACP